MKTTTDKYGFMADRPISNKEQDLLNRAGFSVDLANAIVSWHGKDSLVIAIHGEWGSGKSSIKNMALSYLESLDKEKKPTVIEFSPWEWSAQEKINEAFFEEISKAIGRKDKSEESKEIAKIFRKYGRYLNTADITFSGISSSYPTLLVLFSLAGSSFGALGSWINQNWIGTTFLSLITVYLLVMKWGSETLKRFSTDYDEKAKDAEKSLREIRDELKEKLGKRGSSILIVMDDLDRLTSDELMMIFQLTKANSEFPNVVFLLLFQRDIVEEKLTIGKQSGRDYLEKIIQVPFDIPAISTTDIHTILFERLDGIVNSDPSILALFDQHRWGNVFHAGLSSYFGNLRNVYRYTSTLSFHFSLLKGKKAFEANPIDLFVIECLRLFEPDIYKEIASSKTMFVGGGDRTDRTRKDDYIRIFNSICDKASPSNRDAVRSLIIHLFPTIEWAVSNRGYGDGFIDRWLKEMRICHEANFDRYFQFSVPQGTISNSDLTEMLEATASTDSITSILTKFNESGLIKSALSLFESYTDDIKIEHGESYITGILNIGDNLKDDAIGFVDFGSHVSATRLVYWFLKRIEAISERGELLISAFNQSNGVSIVIHLIQAEDGRREKSEPDLLLTDEHLRYLKAMVVQKIEKLAAEKPTSSLLDKENLLPILYSWKRWGGDENVSEWVKEQTSNIEGCLLLLSKCIRKSSSQGVDDYVSRTNKYIKLKYIEDFAPIEPLAEMLKNIDISTIKEPLQEGLVLFQDAIRKRSQGLSEDDD